MIGMAPRCATAVFCIPRALPYTTCCGPIWCAMHAYTTRDRLRLMDPCKAIREHSPRFVSRCRVLLPSSACGYRHRSLRVQSKFVPKTCGSYPSTAAPFTSGDMHRKYLSVWERVAASERWACSLVPGRAVVPPRTCSL
ncbi:hypothetical protein BD309DRAFT_962083 [Dichomitus squalens]|uniref:Uncharacterized protein n=1 Tax=Dichomitus squalens TaxID=114155 RepID=A0A4Q9QAI2_9APHY|nr:hypothetical protein BD309DRAFT_962083 [Dichomitus squalens]TBU64599.1 hypothetical protein BD310DRAFT_405105 [Dichomitus squalens]